MILAKIHVPWNDIAVLLTQIISIGLSLHIFLVNSDDMEIGVFSTKICLFKYNLVIDIENKTVMLET